MKFFTEMSNRERNTWVALLLTLSLSGYYFFSLLNVSGGFNNRDLMGEIAITMLVYVFLASIFMVCLNSWYKKEVRDERDYRFEAQANIRAYSTLFSCTVTLVLFNLFNARYLESSVFGIVEITTTLSANLLLLSMLSAEVVRIITLLFFYRRGY
jgi:hypothetical protein